MYCFVDCLINFIHDIALVYAYLYLLMIVLFDCKQKPFVILLVCIGWAHGCLVWFVCVRIVSDVNVYVRLNAVK